MESDKSTSLPLAVNEAGSVTYSNRESDRRVDRPWRKLESPVVMEVFRIYEQQPRKEAKLFGVTSDVDNLTFYTARFGRPAAENLVALYNQATRNVFDQWAYEKGEDVPALGTIPGGEQMFVLGVTRSRRLAEEFFPTIKDRVMDEMKLAVKKISAEYPIELWSTSVSFGGMVFDTRYDPEIKRMMAAHREEVNGDLAAPIYYRLLEDMRGATGSVLDQQKHSTKHPRLLNRLKLIGAVVARYRTREISRLIEELPQKDISDIFGPLAGPGDAIDFDHPDVRRIAIGLFSNLGEQLRTKMDTSRIIDTDKK